MPTKPISSKVQFRRNAGVNIFSDRPLLDFETEEPDYEAASEYYDNAVEAFARSPEGKLVEQKLESVGWVRFFLELAVNYQGKTVETMSREDAEEIVFELFPRKVSTEAKNAEAIITELRKFWEFIARVYDLAIAGQMIQLFDATAVKRLRRVLSNPGNFGIAKSLFMQGNAAGFDMTTQAGLDQFRLAYNASLENFTGGELGSYDYSPYDGPAARLEHQQSAIPPKPKMTASEKRAFNKQRQKKLAQRQKKR